MGIRSDGRGFSYASLMPLPLCQPGSGMGEECGLRHVPHVSPWTTIYD